MTGEASPTRRPQTWLRSFAAALAGIRSALRTQRNLRVHLAAAAAALGLAAAWRFSPVEFACVLLCIGLVWSAELLNTAVEAVVDLLSPEHREAARVAKDTAAGGVLAAALAALAVGLVLYAGPAWRALARMIGGLGE